MKRSASVKGVKAVQLHLSIMRMAHFHNTFGITYSSYAACNALKICTPMPCHILLPGQKNLNFSWKNCPTKNFFVVKKSFNIIFKSKHKIFNHRQNNCYLRKKNILSWSKIILNSQKDEKLISNSLCWCKNDCKFKKCRQFVCS